MKSFTLVLLLALFLGTSSARAAPPIERVTIPGLQQDEWARTIEYAKQRTQEIFNKYGGRVGYPGGSKLDHADAQCMVGLLAHAFVTAWRNTLPSGTPEVVRLDQAAEYLKRNSDFWCGQGGPPQENRALQMLAQAAQDTVKAGQVNRNAERSLPSGWKKQLDALLKKDQWSPAEVALVGTVAVLLLAREAVPMP
ncbi:hypothetical protein [Myxococcus landrumensis]|uniref:Uncharacterized protein n=1 Tax=Myxococcus landrumensis TaxID=2813577 RepID=A0ABX7NEJ9_9BACT|nr:hypothetical protein [Myxococcus landrumus]QSQ17210.1 hypothetical protein JY572_14610 [Myxococcus landrumus]